MNLASCLLVLLMVAGCDNAVGDVNADVETPDASSDGGREDTGTDADQKDSDRADADFDESSIGDAEVDVEPDDPVRMNPDGSFSIRRDDGETFTREPYKRKIVEWVRRVIVHYRDRNEVALVPLNATIDSWLGFPNEPDGEGGIVHTNAVHPNEIGYGQMAETIYGWLKNQ